MADSDSKQNSELGTARKMTDVFFSYFNGSRSGGWGSSCTYFVMFKSNLFINVKRYLLFEKRFAK